MQLRQVLIHLPVDLEWAMCWSLEPLLLASLVLPFDLKTPTTLATQRRDLDVVKIYESRMNKLPDSGYKDISKLPCPRKILSISLNRIVFLLRSRESVEQYTKLMSRGSRN